MFARLFNRSLFAAAATLAAAGATFGQCTLQKMVPVDIAANDGYGTSVSLDFGPFGPTAAIGVPGDDLPGISNAGSVRFVTHPANSPWSMNTIPMLTAPDAHANGVFGKAVAYDDPTLAVSSDNSVYMFFRTNSQSNWLLSSKIPAPVNGSNFGYSVSVSGLWAVVGAPNQTFVNGVINASAGAAHFYKKQNDGTWQLQGTFDDADATGIRTDDELGYAVSISGDVAVIGAPYGEAPDLVTGQHGYIHILRRSIFDGWVNDVPGGYDVVVPGIGWGDEFGAALSTDGTTIAVGAPGKFLAAGQVPGKPAMSAAGCVYMIRYANGLWQQDGMLVAPDAQASARFGSSVKVVGDRVAIGAAGTAGEAAYIFRRVAAGQWVVDSRIADPDNTVTPADSFGNSIGFDGTYIVIGDAIDNQNNLTNSGAVYAAAPTPNSGDDCGHPLIANGTTFTGCTTFASTDMHADCDVSLGGSPDVWYSWVPNCSGNVIMDTFGSNFDTILSIHSQCPEPGNTHTITCSDDAGGAFGTISLVTFDYTAGTQYLIRVSGYNGAKGDYQLRINDWQTPGNDTCSSPLDVAVNSTTTFKNCKATLDTGLLGNCMANGAADLWFRVTPPVTGVLSVDTCGSNYDTILALYNIGTCPTPGNGLQIACNDDIGIGHACSATTSAFNTTIIGGFPYLIRVAGYATTSPVGNGVLNVSFAPNCPCDWNLSGIVSVQDIFDFLASYFAGQGDFNHSGQTTVQDIFDFLSCYFGGCP